MAKRRIFLHEDVNETVVACGFSALFIRDFRVRVLLLLFGLLLAKIALFPLLIGCVARTTVR